jgi:hypothetical protein
MAGNVQVRSPVHAVVAEPQRAVLTSPESERGMAGAQHSDLVAQEMNHQSARRLARPHHWPTLTPRCRGWPPVVEGCPLVTMAVGRSTEFY